MICVLLKYGDCYELEPVMVSISVLTQSNTILSDILPIYEFEWNLLLRKPIWYGNPFISPCNCPRKCVTRKIIQLTVALLSNFSLMFFIFVNGFARKLGLIFFLIRYFIKVREAWIICRARNAG